MKNIILWFKIIRSHTLFASFCPVLVGLMAEGVSSWGVAAVTLLCALSLQILSILINDYYDFRRGSDKAGRVGPSRALAEGKVTEVQMLRAVFVTLVLCLVSGLYLVFRGGWPILLIGLASLLFAWLYTATRFALSYLGIADVFVFLFYGVVASAGTAYLQMHGFSWTAFHAGAVCGLISMCLLIINNLRDIDDDRAAGKRTFPVRLANGQEKSACWWWFCRCRSLHGWPSALTGRCWWFFPRSRCSWRSYVRRAANTIDLCCARVL